MMDVNIGFRRFPGNSDIPLPRQASGQAAGVDLCASIPCEQAIKPGERALISSGIGIELPPGYEAQIRPRSGLAFEHGLSVLNAPGTIDSDYRGEIKILLINLGNTVFHITRGMRIAQMVIAPVMSVRWVAVEALSETARGPSGFGSTGLEKNLQA